MPFTGAHPLAVVPFIYARRLRLDPTCLVIGSMSPDFEYFARVKLVSTIGHTLHGIALWCVPVTLVSAWLFHRVIKWPAVRVLPRSVGSRVAAFAERPWVPSWTAAAVASLVISAVLGAITHLVWDSFTHRGWWGPENIAVLNNVYDVPVLGPMVVHRILQHTCTVVGLAALGLLVVRALRRVQLVAVEPRGHVVWFACVLLATAAAYLKMLRNHETDIGSLVVAPICGLLAGALVAGAIATLRGE